MIKKFHTRTTTSLRKCKWKKNYAHLRDKFHKITALKNFCKKMLTITLINALHWTQTSYYTCTLIRSDNKQHSRRSHWAQFYYIPCFAVCNDILLPEIHSGFHVSVVVVCYQSLLNTNYFWRFSRHERSLWSNRAWRGRTSCCSGGIFPLIDQYTVQFSVSSPIK